MASSVHKRSLCEELEDESDWSNSLLMLTSTQLGREDLIGSHLLVLYLEARLM